MTEGSAGPRRQGFFVFLIQLLARLRPTPRRAHPPLSQCKRGPCDSTLESSYTTGAGYISTYLRQKAGTFRVTRIPSRVKARFRWDRRSVCKTSGGAALCTKTQGGVGCAREQVRAPRHAGVRCASGRLGDRDITDHRAHVLHQCGHRRQPIRAPDRGGGRRRRASIRGFGGRRRR